MASKVPISKRLEYAHFNFTHEEWDAINFKKLRDPLEGYKTIEDTAIFARAIRDPKNFYFTLRYVFNIEPTIFQLVILQELWETPNPMFIASRGASKSWTFGLYALMKAVLCQGSKVVLVSASFRQAKNMFKYAENIFYNAPVLMDICGNDCNPSKNSDMWEWKIGSSIIVAVPLGTSGDKIRGLRASVILVDEYQCISPDSIVETDRGLIRIKDCMLREDISVTNMLGEYEKPDDFIITPEIDVYEVITDFGYSFQCSDRHKVLTKNGFKLAIELTNEDYLCYENKYKFPNNNMQEEELKIAKDSALLMGMAVDNEIPASILQSPRDIVLKFMTGAFCRNADFTVYEKDHIFCEFFAKSHQLSKEIQIVLLKLGYRSEILNYFDGQTNIWVVILEGSQAYNFAKEVDIKKWLDKIESCCEINSQQTIQLEDEWLRVKSVTKLNKQEKLYDFNLPITHSFYANGIVQHNSMSEEIFETVISPFASVSIDPSENVKKMARVKLLKEEGLWTDDHQKALNEGHRPNQIILAGTGDWDFKHFSKYWKKWRSIINNESGEDTHGYSRSHYKVIRLPWDIIPEGFMEGEHIAKAKATANTERFMCEYGAVFIKDSSGFFKRSLIESCVTKTPIELASGPVTFHARTRGDFNGKYVYGIDPASESDNLAIVILEMYPDHHRVVYCWTAKRTNMKQKDTEIKENDFYQFIARKVRNLMKVFPCELIALDSQGGGIGVMQALSNLRTLETGEVAIWPITKDHQLFIPGTRDYGYDDEHGRHIIEMVQMARADYVVEANHGLKKDMQDKMLLFPFIDPLEIGFAEMQDEKEKSSDPLKEILLEIEELKEELSTIIHSTTQNGRDKWDTPETIIPGSGKKGRLRKDRYSALLMANAAARRMARPTTINHDAKSSGGFAHMMANNKVNPNDKMYVGPDWFVNKGGMGGWGTTIKRGGVLR